MSGGSPSGVEYSSTPMHGILKSTFETTLDKNGSASSPCVSTAESSVSVPDCEVEMSRPRSALHHQLRKISGSREKQYSIAQENTKQVRSVDCKPGR